MSTHIYYYKNLYVTRFHGGKDKGMLWQFHLSAQDTELNKAELIQLINALENSL